MKIRTHILVFALVLSCTVVYGFGGSGEFGKWKLMLQKLRWSILPKTSEAVDLGSSSKKFGEVHVVDGYIDNIQGDTAGDWQAATDKVEADSGNWDDAYDKQVDTWTAPLDWTTKTVSISNVNNSDTDGYLTHEQFAILEDKYTQAEDNALLADKADVADTTLFVWRDGSLSFTGKQEFEACFNLKPLAIADSPVSPINGDFWWDSTAADSGPNVYFNNQWCRIATDKAHHGGLTYISTAGTVTVDTGLEYQSVIGGSIAYTATHLHNFTHSAKMLYHEMPNETDKSAIIKQGRVFNKKSIVGKGCEVIVYGDIDATITMKDGTIIKIKTIKPSMFERMFGWMYILKPDNIGVGK